MALTLFSDLPKWTAAEDRSGQSRAASFLLSVENLRERTLDYVARLSEVEFARRLQSPTGPGGQWLVSAFDGGIQGCQVWLSYFHPESYSRLLSLGHIVPHRHQRSFASRLLTGSYAQWTYHLDATMKFRFDKQKIIYADEVYTFDYRDIHLILRPSSDCLSLAIRGPEMYSTKPRRVKSLSFDIDSETVRSYMLHALNQGIKNSKKLYG